MSSLLVTGGAGFIGSNFVRQVLASTDHTVTALDALTGRLSEHARAAGYRHLELQLQERSGRIVPVDELVQTPPARRPRPEPIDDGVRR